MDPTALKFGTVVGEFTRLMRHTTDPLQVASTLSDKAMELRYVGYSTGFLRRAARYVGRKHASLPVMNWGYDGLPTTCRFF